MYHIYIFGLRDMKRITALFVPFLLAACLLISSQVLAEEDWSQQGLSHLKAKRHKEAIDAFSKAIAEAYNNRGVAWHHKGDYDNAISDYDKALELHPHYAEALNNRGVAWAYKGDYDKAISDCTEAVKINPLYANAYNNRGYAWQQKGDLDKAIADYSEALGIDEQYVQAYHSRGFAWAGKGDYDRAIADYDKALEIRPRYADVYGKRGTAWAHKGDLDKAIADYTEAVEIDPEFEEVYYNRAVVWNRKGNCDKAIADFTQALKINPDYSEAYNQLARTLAMCPDAKHRNGAKAVKYANKALELSLKAGYLDTLAAAYAEQGQFEDATREQEKAIDLLAGKGGTEKRLAAYRERLKSYKEHKTWRQTLVEAEDEQGGEKETPAGSQVSTPKIFSLQVGAFQSRENAEKMTARLKKKGYAAWTVPMPYSGGKVLHTVLCGKYDTLDQAKTAAAALKKNENISSSIRAIDTP
jgi:tetratricopeptide (TPR) repeat protein